MVLPLDFVLERIQKLTYSKVIYSFIFTHYHKPILQSTVFTRFIIRPFTILNEMNVILLQFNSHFGILILQHHMQIFGFKKNLKPKKYAFYFQYKRTLLFHTSNQKQLRKGSF